MKSILDLTIKPKYKIADNVKIDGNIVNNPNPKLAKFIINYVLDDYCVFSSSDPSLTEFLLNAPNTLHPCQLKNYWSYVSCNSNDLLTDHLIANADKLNPNNLINNENPKLGKIILEILPLVGKYTIAAKSNPVLTDIILNLDSYPYCFRHNTNPRLFDLMAAKCSIDGALLSNSKFVMYVKSNLEKIRLINISLANLVEFEKFSYPPIKQYTYEKMIETKIKQISGNPNPGLTKFILDHEHLVDFEELSINTNPNLADLIIRNSSKLNKYKIINNPNPGLTEFLINSIHYFSTTYYYTTCKNTNPGLAEDIINNTDMRFIIENSNTGLTEFIKKNFRPEYTKYLLMNTNPLLADLIIEFCNDSTEVSSNRNPGLTEYILAHKYDPNKLSKNSNPGLTELLIKCKNIHPDNTNPKLLKHMNPHPSNPIIAVIDKSASKLNLNP